MNIILKENDLSDIDMLEEYNREYSIFPGFKSFATEENYEEVIKNNKKSKEGIGNNGIKEIYYWAVEDRKIVGHASIRLNPEISEPTLIYCGHIMYGVVPSKRKKGYGTYICKLLLNKMKELGYDEAIITCSHDNIGSNNVIKNNGGVLIGSVEPDNNMTDKVTNGYSVKL